MGGGMRIHTRIEIDHDHVGFERVGRNVRPSLIVVGQKEAAEIFEVHHQIGLGAADGADGAIEMVMIPAPAEGGDGEAAEEAIFHLGAVQGVGDGDGRFAQLSKAGHDHR